MKLNDIVDEEYQNNLSIEREEEQID